MQNYQKIFSQSQLKVPKWQTPGKDKKQIVFGLLCSRLGCPTGIEVFSGTTADPNTLQVQMLKIKERFGLDRVVLVGDLGMLTSARIDQDLKSHNLDYGFTEQGYSWVKHFKLSRF